MEPPLRPYNIIEGEKSFKLYERYFVYNYYQNQDKFDSVVMSLICDKISDTTNLIGRYQVRFHGMGRFSRYTKGEYEVADFTRFLGNHYWEIGTPQHLKVGFEDRSQNKEINLDCTRRYEYQIID